MITSDDLDRAVSALKETSYVAGVDSDVERTIRRLLEKEAGDNDVLKGYVLARTLEHTLGQLLALHFQGEDFFSAFLADILTPSRGGLTSILSLVEEQASEAASPMDIKLSRFDPADHLKTETDIALYMEAVMEEGGDDPAYVARALGDVARARNMSALARDVGMTRQGLSKALSGEGNPSFETVAKVSRALGLKLKFEPA